MYYFYRRITERKISFLGEIEYQPVFNFFKTEDTNIDWAQKRLKVKFIECKNQKLIAELENRAIDTIYVADASLYEE